MGSALGPHLPEPELEEYSMGILAEGRMDVFEEHLLTCADCQDRLLDMDSFINAVRSVSPKLREARRPFWKGLFRWRRAVWFVALPAVIILLAALRIGRAPERLEMTPITLSANRGGEGQAAEKASAGKPLSLAVDLTELPAFSSYRLVIVGSMGKQVWEAEARPESGKISVPMRKGLGAGQYYVRLYAPNRELLREFSLAVN
jgi:hypothetical protein